MKMINWLWSLLPDKCEVMGCLRQGVRGNENNRNGLIVCDDCDCKLFDNTTNPIGDE